MLHPKQCNNNNDNNNNNNNSDNNNRNNNCKNIIFYFFFAFFIFNFFGLICFWFYLFIPEKSANQFTYNKFPNEMVK